MLRGINRHDLFEEQEDYQQFLIRLQNLIDPIDDNGEHIPSYFHVYAYCLMSNHVHLLQNMLGVVGRSKTLNENSWYFSYDIKTFHFC